MPPPTPGQQPVPAPRVALFDGNTQYLWSDNQTGFNGFLIVQLILPVNGSSVQWPSANYGNLAPSITLPLWQRIPIINGQINTACGLFLNSDIVPPGTVYNAYYYDTNNVQIAGPTSNFTVTTQNVFTPPLLTLTLPVGPGTPSTPDA